MRELRYAFVFIDVHNVEMMKCVFTCENVKTRIVVVFDQFTQIIACDALTQMCFDERVQQREFNSRMCIWIVFVNVVDVLHQFVVNSHIRIIKSCDDQIDKIIERRKFNKLHFDHIISFRLCCSRFTNNSMHDVLLSCIKQFINCVVFRIHRFVQLWTFRQFHMKLNCHRWKWHCLHRTIRRHSM